MTTNKDRAVEVMRSFWHDGRYAVGFDEITDALADAGLITPDRPRPEDVPEGELWRVEFDGKLDVAVRELPGARNPWWLMRGWRATDAEITLLYRLVPEVKA